MSSKEIADLVDSRHDKVKQSIERLAERGVIQLPPMGEIKTSTKPMAVYNVAKRDSYIVVAQLSPEFTARLVDRWQELEIQLAPVVPQWISDLSPQASIALEDLSNQLAIAAPKVAVYETLADRRGDISTTLMAKNIGIRSAIKLNVILREKGVKMLGMDAPKAGYMEWFNVVSDVKNGHEFTQCLVTPLGQIEIAKMISEGSV